MVAICKVRLEQPAPACSSLLPMSDMSVMYQEFRFFMMCVAQSSAETLSKRVGVAPCKESYRTGTLL